MNNADQIILSFGVHHSQVVTFTTIRLRGLGLKPWPGQKFETRFLLHSHPSAQRWWRHVTRAGWGHKTPPYKTWIPILSYHCVIYWRLCKLQ